MVDYELINEVFASLDAIDEAEFESACAVTEAAIDMYNKACMIMECSGYKNLENYQVFQEMTFFQEEIEQQVNSVPVDNNYPQPQVFQPTNPQPDIQQTQQTAPVQQPQQSVQPQQPVVQNNVQPNANANVTNATINATANNKDKEKLTVKSVLTAPFRLISAIMNAITKFIQGADSKTTDALIEEGEKIPKELMGEAEEAIKANAQQFLQNAPSVEEQNENENVPNKRNIQMYTGYSRLELSSGLFTPLLPIEDASAIIKQTENTLKYISMDVDPKTMSVLDAQFQKEYNKLQPLIEKMKQYVALPVEQRKVVKFKVYKKKVDEILNSINTLNKTCQVRLEQFKKARINADTRNKIPMAADQYEYNNQTLEIRKNTISELSQILQCLMKIMKGTSTDLTLIKTAHVEAIQWLIDNNKWKPKSNWFTNLFSLGTKNEKGQKDLDTFGITRKGVIRNMQKKQFGLAEKQAEKDIRKNKEYADTMLVADNVKDKNMGVELKQQYKDQKKMKRKKG